MSLQTCPSRPAIQGESTVSRVQTDAGHREPIYQDETVDQAVGKEEEVQEGSGELPSILGGSRSGGGGWQSGQGSGGEVSYG